VATALRCSVADDASASFDARDSHRRGAGSSSGEGSPWAEQEVLADSLAGRTSTITTRQKILRADPGLEAAKRGWNGLPCSSAQVPWITHVIAHVGHSRDHRITPWSAADPTGSAVLDYVMVMVTVREVWALLTWCPVIFVSRTRKVIE